MIVGKMQDDFLVDYIPETTGASLGGRWEG